jgi:hypothetical protein
LICLLVLHDGPPFFPLPCLGELFPLAWAKIDRRDELWMNLVDFGALFCANFLELLQGELRRIYLPRTPVNRLSSDASGARELRILYETQLPQVDVRFS